MSDLVKKVTLAIADPSAEIGDKNGMILSVWKAHAALSAIHPGLLDGTAVVVPVKLLREAHAVMRECGWQLAPASEPQGDGVLEAAVAEIESQFADLLDDVKDAANA